MDFCDPKKLLQENGIRATVKKTEVLGTILHSEKMLSAGEIFGILKNKIRIDLVTVYRTLAILREQGIVREINDNSGAQLYEKSCRHNPPHAHFKCRICGEMRCIKCPEKDSEEYIKNIAGGCVVESFSIVLNGVCKKCKKFS